MKSVFISHSSKDKAIADLIVHSLEQEAISVWIAPRDILPSYREKFQQNLTLIGRETCKPKHMYSKNRYLNGTEV